MAEAETQTSEEIRTSLRQYRKAARELNDILLTNLVMIGEVPSPTFGEEMRVRLLEDRFAMCGLDNCSTDEVGNALGILPGSDGEENILVVAHVDSLFAETVDHTINVQPDKVTGPGVGDNALGVATLATLPSLLEQLGIQLRHNLILLGGARSLGRGNLEGLRFFLKNCKLPLKAGVCLEGVPLGRLSYSSIGMLRGEIHCAVPEEYDWTRFGVVGAISSLNEVINSISEIPLPRRPRTSVVLGSISGGQAFNVIAKEAVLRFEIRSESADVVENIRRQIDDITAEVSARTNAGVTLRVLAVRNPGGIPFQHPLVRNARDIMKALGVKNRMSPSTSELTAFISEDIPAVTLGITRGDRLNEPDETLQIKPMFSGLAQILGVLLAIDNGCCDES